MRSQLLSYSALAAAGAVAASLLSCNLTGGIDSPKSTPEHFIDAQTKADNGDCAGAVTELNAIANPDDRTLQMLGAANLCVAGANTNKIDAALGSYDPTLNNLVVVGTLANSLVPFVTGADTSAAAAVTAFRAMSATDFGAVWQIYGDLVQIAVLEAKAAGAGATTVVKANISPSTCANANCATAPAACGAAGMNDADANVAFTALSNAATAAGNTSITNVTKIASQLQSLLGGSILPNAVRCVLFNNTLSN